MSDTSPDTSPAASPDASVGAEPHRASLALWDLSSPLVIGRPSTMKVAGKCSAGCQLTGQEIEICNEAGIRIADARLGPAPWPGTNGLYWGEAEFLAPATEGAYNWTLKFAHGEALSNFHFITVKPPEHTLTVKIVEKEGKTPLPDVEVRLGVYRASSDERGVATLEVASGSYDLGIWKEGYESFSKVLEVAADRTIAVEIVSAPEPEQPYWM